MSDINPDVEVDRWVALASWSTGVWTDARYADYLEAHPEHDPDDTAEAIIINRLREEA